MQKLKKINTLVLIVCSWPIYSQIGINIPDPKATLHIDGSKTQFKGIIIPNISQEEAYNMPLSSDQNTMLVYIKETSIHLSEEKMKYVYYPGFYYWNGNYWVPLASTLTQTKGNSPNTKEHSSFRLFKSIDNPYYGELGNNSVDLSYAYTGSNNGVTGNESFAVGIMNKVSGARSAAFGGFNSASGSNSMAWGGNPISNIGNFATGNNSSVWGMRSEAKGHLSTAFGNRNTSYSGYETVFGAYSTSYIPIVESYNNQFDEAYSNSNRLLNIGNGLSYSKKSDAFTILKNGNVGIAINNFEKSTSDAKVQINGSLKINAETPVLSANVCDNKNLGKIIFVEDNFYGCKSTGWILLN